MLRGVFGSVFGCGRLTCSRLYPDSQCIGSGNVREHHGCDLQAIVLLIYMLHVLLSEHAIQVQQEGSPGLQGCGLDESGIRVSGLVDVAFIVHHTDFIMPP